MSSGRTSPMLATCSGRGSDVDAVVKLNGGMDFGVRGAVFELTASLIAQRIGVDCPKPLLVRLTKEFLEVVSYLHPEKSKALRASEGVNFGTELVKGMIIFGSSEQVPKSETCDALRIFAFDGLIQNPDRSVANPNLYRLSDKLIVLDHECAFSFLTAILKPSQAWELGSADFMERHALRYELSNSNLDWPACWDSFGTISKSFFEEVRDSLPADWNGERDVDAIETHVSAVLEHTAEFEENLRGRIL